MKLIDAATRFQSGPSSQEELCNMNGLEANGMDQILLYDWRRTLMYKVYMACCLGLLTTFSLSLYADTAGDAEAVAAAEKSCLEAAQKHYGVPADAVSQGTTKTKWASGLGGYQVDLLIKKQNGKSAEYSCIAKPNGVFKFFAG